MNRLLRFWAVATLLVGMAACSGKGKDIPVNPEDTTAEVVARFNACTTRVSLNGTKQLWEAGDEIDINGTTFTTVEAGEKVTFTAKNCDIAAGEAIVARYGKAEIATKQSAREGNLPAATPAFAVGNYTSGVELTFSTVASLLKFSPKVSGDITFASTDGSALAGLFDVEESGEVIFATDGATSVTLTGCEAGKSYYVAIAPVMLSSELAITCGGDALTCDNKHLSFEANTIYNLGTIATEGEYVGKDEPKQSHSIYLYKHKNSWSEVKLYSWDAASATYNGEWPGEAPQREEMINGHRYLVWDMAEEADGVELNILINDGRAEGGEQSADYALGVFDGDRYIRLNGTTLSDIEDKRDPIPAGDPEDPGSDVPVGGGYKVYVYQHNNSWSLNLYAWDEAGTALTGEWPGSAASARESINGYEYQVWRLPASVSGAKVGLLLNGGGDDTKTEDYDLGIFDGDRYLLLDGTTISEIADKNNPVPSTPDVPVGDGYKVYVYQHNNSWSLNLYAWDEAGTALTGNWPGSAASARENINGYEYQVWTLPASVNSAKVGLLLNGGGDDTKTEDYDLGIFDGDRYLLLDGTTISEIADKNNPVPSTPDVPVGDGYKVYVYQHNNSWSLNLYAWDEAGTALTGEWPGSAASARESINGYEYQVWRLPASVSGAKVGLLLNGGGDDTKTEDYDLGIFDGDRYLLLDGTTIKEIVDKNNPLPSTPDEPQDGELYGDWAIVGEHQGWDLANPTRLAKVAENVYLCSDIELKDSGFKFVKVGISNWDGANTHFGAWKKSDGKEYFDFSTEMSSGDWYSVYDNNLGEHKENIGVGDWSKRYDIYIRVAERAEWGEHLQYTVVEHGVSVSF